MKTEKEKIKLPFTDMSSSDWTEMCKLREEERIEAYEKGKEAGKAEAIKEWGNQLADHYQAGRKEAIKQFSKDLKKRIRNKDGEFGGYSLGDFATELAIKVIDEELKSKIGEVAR